ncbi:hypothetical protein [Pseudalkalibacillus decolorationis]|uniref:hypothetical protein n=1 Tax=Pseudalkalibacillus decolorationis TaxID=163879 RepID=UPI00214946D6|nr:hypothetical protein [Pseudalkalibacillus decolorationis]
MWFSWEVHAGIPSLSSSVLALDFTICSEIKFVSERSELKRSPSILIIEKGFAISLVGSSVKKRSPNNNGPRTITIVKNKGAIVSI